MRFRNEGYVLFSLKKLNMYSADFFQDNMLFMAYVQSLPFNKAMVDIA